MCSQINPAARKFPADSGLQTYRRFTRLEWLYAAAATDRSTLFLTRASERADYIVLPAARALDKYREREITKHNARPPFCVYV